MCRNLPSAIRSFFKNLIQRKDYTEIEKEIATNNELDPRLNTIQLLALGIGAIIG